MGFICLIENGHRFEELDSFLNYRFIGQEYRRYFCLKRSPFIPFCRIDRDKLNGINRKFVALIPKIFIQIEPKIIF